jgi:hypothetical protein
MVTLAIHSEDVNCMKENQKNQQTHAIHLHVAQMLNVGSLIQTLYVNVYQNIMVILMLAVDQNV